MSALDYRGLLTVPFAATNCFVFDKLTEKVYDTVYTEYNSIYRIVVLQKICYIFMI